MSLACLLLLNPQLFSSILSAKWLNQQASFLKLFKHGDAKLSPAVLIQSVIETFTEQEVQSGAPNSFNIDEIGKTYNKNVRVWDVERGEHRRPKLQELSLQTIRYYLSKPAFLDMAIKVFHRVRDAALKRKGLERDLALLEAVNNCLADDCQIQDIVCFDGCYKHVHKDLAEPFRGKRNNSKRQVDQDGNVTKKANAQLGIQVGFSLIKRLPISVDVTSATYNERESVSLSPNTLVICDAGYLEYQMLAKASEYNAFLLVNGKFNMRGVSKTSLLMRLIRPQSTVVLTYRINVLGTSLTLIISTCRLRSPTRIRLVKLRMVSLSSILKNSASESFVIMVSDRPRSASLAFLLPIYHPMCLAISFNALCVLVGLLRTILRS